MKSPPTGNCRPIIQRSLETKIISVFRALFAGTCAALLATQLAVADSLREHL